MNGQMGYFVLEIRVKKSGEKPNQSLDNRKAPDIVDSFKVVHKTNYNIHHKSSRKNI